MHPLIDNLLIGSVTAVFATVVLILLSSRTTVVIGNHQSQTEQLHQRQEENVLTKCLSSHALTNFSTPGSPQYHHFLHSRIQNLVFTRPTFLGPTAIIFPLSLQELTAAIHCSNRASLLIRLRSGGHSYAGHSSTAASPFAIIDLANIDGVEIDLDSRTAWVGSGATISRLYRAISRSAGPTLAFPAGFCPDVAAGGHFSGGGFGMLSRVHGLAADNVVDALLVDARGRALDRAAMGEDVFWALRGGGGGTFGAVHSWKIRLVPVPETTTVIGVKRSGGAAELAGLMHKWQLVAPALSDEHYLTVTVVGESGESLSMSFDGFYAGRMAEALAELGRAFPELGVGKEDMAEMSWFEATEYFSSGEAAEEHTMRDYMKVKMDIVREAIPVEGVSGALEWLLKEPRKGSITCTPEGGFMGRVGTGSTPYPHRAGGLYKLMYLVNWKQDEDGSSQKYVDWISGFYEHMGAFMSKDPIRVGEVNMLDFDHGEMDWEGVDMCDWWKVGRLWGDRYFLGNYHSLVRAKTLIDPNNVFRHPQSIPPLPLHCRGELSISVGQPNLDTEYYSITSMKDEL